MSNITHVQTWMPETASQPQVRLGMALAQWVKSEFEAYCGVPVLAGKSSQVILRHSDGTQSCSDHFEIVDGAVAVDGTVRDGLPSLPQTAESAAWLMLDSLCHQWREKSLMAEGPLCLVWRTPPEISPGFRPSPVWRSYVRLSIVQCSPEQIVDGDRHV